MPILKRLADLAWGRFRPQDAGIRGGAYESAGVDTINAVSEALKVIGIILYNSDEWLNGHLTWLGM